MIFHKKETGERKAIADFSDRYYNRKREKNRAVGELPGEYTYIMKKIIFRIGILAAVFVASVFLFSTFFNKTETVHTRDAVSASLPVMYMVTEGTDVNPMYGYRQDMQEDTLRDGLTPLAADREITVRINTEGQQISGLEYQLTDPEDGSVSENGLVRDLTGDGQLLSGSFTLSAPTVMNREYLLRFTLTVGDETIYYYTRLLQRSTTSVGTYLDFAAAFSTNCVNNTLTEEQLDCLETDNSKASSSYHQVDITSSREQLTWGDLHPTVVRQGVPVISEINETTASITQSYLLSAQDEEGNTEYYRVDEFYRMRCAQDQVVLLDFQRETTEYFDSSLPVQVSGGLDLGIVGKDLEFTANDNGDIAAFVQNGELWSYNRGTNKVTRVFSFRQEGEVDERTSGRQYDIHVCSVSEAGDISFVVYGYMCADRYEGKNGIALYHFSAERSAVDERLFIPVDISYEYMAQDLSRLTYINSSDQFYFYLTGDLCMADLTDGTVTICQQNLLDDCFYVSDSQKNAAWMDQNDSNASTSFTVMNLESGVKRSSQASSGDYVRVLGFTNEDVVFGLARQEDLIEGISGKVTFPMYRLCIQDLDGEILKDYQQDNIYVTEVEKTNDILELHRLARTEAGYAETGDDQIISSREGAEESVEIDLAVEERRGTCGQLEFSASSDADNLLSLEAKRTDSSLAAGELPDFTPDSRYAVYGYGTLQTRLTQLNTAIQTADACVGVVLDSEQRYMWERGNTVSSITLDTASIPEGVLQAPMDMTQLQEALGDSATALNLCGCSLEEVEYQISSGYPVVVRLSLEETALMVGYDSNNVWVYSQSTGQVTPIASDDATALFASFGNHFMSYRKNEE